MVDEIQNKEAYEEKKKMREKARELAGKEAARAKRPSSFGKYVIWVAILLTLGALFYSSVKKELPQEEDYSVFYESQGRDHIAVGSEHPPYSSNPPSSGWHYNAPAPVGFYADALPDEHVIHNLEHGDIWITYHPRVSEEFITALRAFEHDGKVIITPRETNEFDISLSAWEWVDGFNIEEAGVDSPRIEDFIKRHRNQGPEKVNQPHVESGTDTESMEQSTN